MPLSLRYLQGVQLADTLDVKTILRREDERQAFTAFKGLMSDVSDQLDDLTLVRFLRADTGNLVKSEARLRSTLAWRAARKVDSVLDSPPRHTELYNRLRIRRWMGHDPAGRPVQFERLGQFFGSGNCRAFTKEEWLQATVWAMEDVMLKLRESSEKSSRVVMEYCFIADATDYQLVNGARTIPLLQMLTEEVECNYPEIAGCIVIMNMPAALVSIFKNVVKPFMDPITASKVELHSGVPLERLRELLGVKTIHVIPTDPYTSTPQFTGLSV